MRLMGTVKPPHPRGTFTFLEAEDGSGDYFAHKNEFLKPELFKAGQRVSFLPTPTSRGQAAFQIDVAA